MYYMSYVWCVAEGLSCSSELRSKGLRMRAPSGIHHYKDYIKSINNPHQFTHRTVLNIKNQGGGVIREYTGEVIRRARELFGPCSTA